MTPAKHLTSIKPSYIREILSVVANDDIISLAGGLPSPETFPLRMIAGAVSEMATDKSLFQYAATAGYQPLIEFVKDRYQVSETQEVLITTGSQQGIDLCARVFLGRGDKVVVESPSYLGALQIFAVAQAEILSVNQSLDGPDIEQLERHFNVGDVKCFYAVPDFHNPTGCCWSLEKRRAVAELCIRYQVLLIEDAPYRAIRFSGEELPPVSDYCPDHSVYLQSFSKMISPGLRVAALITPKRWMPLFDKLKQATDLHTSVPSQFLAFKILGNPEFDQHLKNTIERYGNQYQTLANELESLGSEYTFNVVQGGMFIWLNIPECDTLALAKRAIENGVAVVPSSEFYSSDLGQSSALRLNFSHSPPDVLKEGVERLRTIL
jgi:DNA-binding transcriptional MocR family regulator